MATNYKYFSNRDRVVTTNNLTEQIAINSSSAWLSQSYSPNYFTQYATRASLNDTTWSNGTKVFDITFGRSSEATGTSTNLSVEKNIYNQFAKILLGYETNNTIKKFNLNPDSNSPDSVLHNAIFINFARSQFKDKIKQGSVELVFDVNNNKQIKLVDSGSNGVSAKECPTGYYGLLYATASTADLSNLSTAATSKVQGLIFYEAGIAVVSPYIFSKYDAAQPMPSSSNSYLGNHKYGALAIGVTIPTLSGSYNVQTLIPSYTISEVNYGIATHFATASYQATTELNSTIYFCRAFNNEFNFSSNPTYLENSKIVVKGDNPEAQPLAYVTTVGLYNNANQLMAVAKLSEPIKKTPENELIARVRLDF